MIELRVLGALDLRGADGAELLSVLSHPKRVAVLCYLALSAPERFVSRDRLVAVFWPESEESHARNALSQTLRGLRRSLGADVIVKRGTQEVAVSGAHLRCDALDFRDALSAGDHEGALELYRGDVLEGQHLIEEPAFAWWLDGERSWYRERAASVAWAVARAHLDAGNPVKAERVAQRALALVCTDESEVEAFVLALSALDRAAAVNFFHRFERSLHEELGLEPSARLRAVVSGILEGNGVDVPPQPEGRVGADEEPPEEETAAPRSSVDRRTPHDRRAPLGPDPLVDRRVPEGGGSGESWPVPPPSHISPFPGRRGTPRRWGQGIVAAALVLAAAVTFGPIRSGSDLIPDLVAVMPLENGSEMPDLGQLGENIAEQLARKLLETQLVQVVPMVTTRAALAGQDGDPVELLATATGAGTVLDGSYYRRADTFRLTIQIIDARDGRVRSSPQASGPQSVPWRTVAALSQRVLGAFEARFGDIKNAAWERNPPNYDALVAYKAAVDQVGRRDLEGALESLALARELDLSFIPPLWIAQSIHWERSDFERADSVLRTLQGFRGMLEPFGRIMLDERQAQMRGDLRARLEFARSWVDLVPDGSEPWYHLARAALDASRPEEAIEALRRSSPDLWLFRDASGFWDVYTTAYHLLGDHEAERRVAEEGRDRLPHLMASVAYEVRALAAMGRVEEVAGLLGESLVLAPSEGWTQASLILEGALEFRAHGYDRESVDLLTMARNRCANPPPDEVGTERLNLDYANVLYASGDLAAAQRLWNALASGRPENIDYQGRLGVLAARLGDVEEADRVDTLLAGLDPTYLYGRHTMWRARMAAVRGESERALRLLAEANSRGHPFGIDLHRDVDLEGLRGLAAFEELVRPDS